VCQRLKSELAEMRQEKIELADSLRVKEEELSSKAQMYESSVSSAGDSHQQLLRVQEECTALKSSTDEALATLRSEKDSLDRKVQEIESTSSILQNQVTEYQEKFDVESRAFAEEREKFLVKLKESEQASIGLEEDFDRYKKKTEAVFLTMQNEVMEAREKMEKLESMRLASETEFESYKKKAEAALASSMSAASSISSEHEMKLKMAQERSLALEQELETIKKEAEVKMEAQSTAERKRLEILYGEQRKSMVDQYEKKISENDRVIKELQKKIEGVRHHSLHEQASLKAELESLEKARVETANTLTEHAQLVQKAQEAKEVEEDLRKQIDGLQAKVVDIKQRAKEAIREAVVSASRKDSTIGTGSKPFRARTSSLDSVEQGLLDSSMDSTITTNESSTMMPTTVAATTRGPQFQQQQPIAANAAPRGTTADVAGAFKLLFSQSRGAVQDAYRRGDFSGISRLRLTFTILVYSVLVHLSLFSLWWTCK